MFRAGVFVGAALALLVFCAPAVHCYFPTLTTGGGSIDFQPSGCDMDPDTGFVACMFDDGAWKLQVFDADGGDVVSESISVGGTTAASVEDLSFGGGYIAVLASTSTDPYLQSYSFDSGSISFIAQTQAEFSHVAVTAQQVYVNSGTNLYSYTSNGDLTTASSSVGSVSSYVELETHDSLSILYGITDASIDVYALDGSGLLSASPVTTSFSGTKSIRPYTAAQRGNYIYLSGTQGILIIHLDGSGDPTAEYAGIPNWYSGHVVYSTGVGVYLNYDDTNWYINNDEASIQSADASAPNDFELALLNPDTDQLWWFHSGGGFTIYDGRECHIDDTCPVGGGDPHFVGLNGVHFLFHGVSGSSYALLSSPNVAVNAIFDGSIGDADGLFMTEFGLLVGKHRVKIDTRGQVTVNNVVTSTARLTYDETYIGCMDVLPGKGHVGSVNSVAECQNACRQLGFPLAGISNLGESCECFTFDAPFHLLPKAWCTERCALDHNLCGSNHDDGGMSLYESRVRVEELTIGTFDEQSLRSFLWTSEGPAFIDRTVRVETGLFTLTVMSEIRDGGLRNLNFALHQKDKFRTQLMDGVVGQTGQDKYYPSVYEGVRPSLAQINRTSSTKVGGGGVTHDPVEFSDEYPLRGSGVHNYETPEIFSTEFVYDLFVRC